MLSNATQKQMIDAVIEVSKNVINPAIESLKKENIEIKKKLMNQQNELVGVIKLAARSDQ